MPDVLVPNMRPNNESNFHMVYTTKLSESSCSYFNKRQYNYCDNTAAVEYVRTTKGAMALPYMCTSDT